MAEKLEGREIIFEYVPVGDIMRVSAMDAKTLTEITVQVPITAGEKTFRHHALARLEYVLKKKKLI